MKSVIISYGSPRSGTTCMEKALSHLAVFNHKISEDDPHHPCQSDDGLVLLAHLFRRKRLVFVRTVRHPMDIADSFVYARSYYGRDKTIGGIGANSDEDIVSWIASESMNAPPQIERIDVPNTWTIEVPYEMIGLPERWIHHIASLTPGKLRADRAVRYLRDTWRKQPARIGKLSEGVGNRVMSDKQWQWFAERLSEPVKSYEAQSDRVILHGEWP